MGLATTLLRSRTLAALTQPHGVDRYLELVNPMWAATEVRARVVDVRRETTGEHPVATVTLQPTATWRGHRAGKYVQVGIEVPGARRTTRCFTVSSPASQPGEAFTITVRAHAEGLVSRFLVEQAEPGLLVHLSQAQGEFCLTESPATPTNNHLLLLTGGSGITPAMSMLRTLLRDGYDGHVGRRVTFLHYARGPEDQIFADELAAIAAADNGVRVVLRHESAGDPLFSAIDLARLVPDFRDVDTWVCGPPALMELVELAYDGSPRLRTERFKPPVLRAGNAEGDVVFERSGRQAANTGASLLEQAEAAGLTPEFGCRMGICFSCTARKSDGTVRNLLTGEESSLPDEDVRICVSAPVGDCSVDL
ncbi:iron-sulfur cluster-binding domain-containing protein [Nocardioides zeae]|uniref:Iron-sulfur cluster-binding domain-containing protein n=1 Tax=Nocardioides imazamoxiresistens TaxID=3231893 RepID=A0ABU3Q0N8_9ACTN|nr:iron-sulfur cluster-binding domain-containing protein [Nocardioides zeae]MDT9595078.1 iron-sulfur cluster-binding domain-containing protein [Nocardioides zeae]